MVLNTPINGFKYTFIFFSFQLNDMPSKNALPVFSLWSMNPLVSAEQYCLFFYD